MKTTETKDIKDLLNKNLAVQKNYKPDTKKFRGAKLMEERAKRDGRIAAYLHAIRLVHDAENGLL